MLLDVSAFQPTLRKQNQELYIFDAVRGKYFMLTPEEWVRQAIVFLLTQQNYPPNLMQIERGIAYPNRVKRPDIVVYDRAGKPFLLIECKAPYIPLREDTLAQARTYNWVVQAPFVAITNGSMMFVYDTASLTWLETLPTYPD
jgi:hypothetical protein